MCACVYRERKREEREPEVLKLTENNRQHYSFLPPSSPTVYPIQVPGLQHLKPKSHARPTQHPTPPHLLDEITLEAAWRAYPPAKPDTPKTWGGGFFFPPEARPHLPVLYLIASKDWFGLRNCSKSKEIKSPVAILLFPRTDIHTLALFLPSQPLPPAGPSQKGFLGGSNRDPAFSHVSPLNPRPNVHEAPGACAQPSEAISANPSHPLPPSPLTYTPHSGPQSARECAGSGIGPGRQYWVTPAFLPHARLIQSALSLPPGSYSREGPEQRAS